MKIKITNTTTTFAVKEAFNKTFPFLKIEFLKTRHGAGEPSAASDIITVETMLGDINKNLSEAVIIVRPLDAVADIELSFQQGLGLPIQVFRKQRNSWIETTKTDKLTLFHQNSMGEESCRASAPAELHDRYLEDGQY